MSLSRKYSSAIKWISPTTKIIGTNAIKAVRNANHNR